MKKDWQEILKEEFNKPYFEKLLSFIKDEYKNKTIYPPYDKIFSAFSYTGYNEVKVVILGQDPYHQPNQAEGLAFSVSDNIQRPPSLRNILKEINDDVGESIIKNNSLIPWAKQGVLLLNTVLTVEYNKPQSHKNKGWEIFTDAVISKLNEREEGIVFLLWGNPAKQKANLITAPRHHILTAAHPSPLSASRGFFGCKHFSKTNKLLKEPILW